MKARLQRDAVDELEFEPSVDASRFGVIGKGGIVIFTGKASSYAEKYPVFEAGEGIKFWRGLLCAYAISVAFWLMAGGVVWCVTR